MQTHGDKSLIDLRFPAGALALGLLLRLAR